MTYKFNVSEARTAMACPRVFYFDVVRSRAGNGTKRITRIWCGKLTDATAAGGLFHNTVEKFNKLARTEPQVRLALQATLSESAKTRNETLRNELLRIAGDLCIDFKRLTAMTPSRISAFSDTLQRYMGELADVLAYAVNEGRPVADILEEFFSDHSKRVDVTYDVGSGKVRVNLRGSIDYIYFDYRVHSDRIIDFKLTSSEQSSQDLTQAALYALLHHQQHQTYCSAAVLYLFPERKMFELSWELVYQKRHLMFDLLASMAAWSEYDEKKGVGLKPPGETQLCGNCRWNKNGECESRLGEKATGERLTHWTQAADQHVSIEPSIERIDPAGLPDPVSFDDEIDESSPSSNAESFNSKCDDGDSSMDTESPASLMLGETTTARKSVFIPLSAMNTHTAVIGAAGSGKTWMAKAIAEEAIRQRVPVLAVDPQGDLVQMLKPRPIAEIPHSLRGLYEEFHRRVEVRIYTPGTSHAERLSLSPIRMPSDADLAHLQRPERRAEELESMLSGCAGNLVSLAAIGGETESQRTLIFKILAWLRQKSVLSIGLGDVISALQAPDSCGIADADFVLKKTEREKLARKLYAFMEGPASNMFRDGTPLDLDRMVTTNDPTRIPLNIIYLNALPGDQEKQFFTGMLAEEVYRWMLTAKNVPDQPSLLFYLDEARDFIPAGNRKTPAKASLLRLFTQGRKYGLGCLLCTQSPRSVDYNAFGNCSTKIIGRLEAAQDVERVQEWFTLSGATPSWIAERKGAKPGSFVGRWPHSSAEIEGQSFTSRILFTEHSGAWPPDRLEDEWRNRR